jgi:NADH:ubiquinone oxidoreductase subunit F (NADH-binding)
MPNDATFPLAQRGSPALSLASGVPRLLPRTPDGKPGRAPQDLAAHQARHGLLPYRGGAGRLITELQAAGLTGRGGAAFPVHRKLQAVFDAARTTGRQPVVVANGAESEPASDKDATLLWLAPHLVLDGLQLAAEAVGARSAVLYAHAVAGQGPHRGSLDSLRDAVARRHAARLDRVPVQLVQAPPRFLAGQETALVSHLNGGPAIPAFIPPRPAERGLGNAPTLISNVETLAHMALVARHGPDWFRALGTPEEPGSLLCTVRRGDGAPRIIEVPLGTPLTALLGPVSEHSPAQQAQGRQAHGQQGAVLIGGYHGTWVPAARASGLTLDNASLARAGARVGAGIVIALPPGRCGLIETARVVRYLTLESAGQCGPCLNGLPRIAAGLAEIAGGRPRHGVRADVERWAGLVTGRGACHHPDGTARLVRSALVVFAAEADLHERGRCSALRHAAPFLPIPQAAARTEADWR